MTLFIHLWFLLHSIPGIALISGEAIDTPSNYDYVEVEVKSVLSDELDQVYVEISLPVSAAVGFEIYDEEGKILHFWHHQELAEGKHDLALGLPELSSGKYALHILVDSSLYRHLVLIP